MSVAAWIYLAMSLWVHPRDQDEHRYYEIAHDIVAAAEEHPLYTGPDAVAKTALLIASVASFESQFRADVDDGRVTGDKGAARCIM